MEQEKTIQESPGVQEESSSTPKKDGVGPTIGIIIIVILIILGGLYIWSVQSNKKTVDKITANSASVTAPVKLATPKDEPAQIQTDLNSFNTKKFDSQIDSDLKAINTAL